LIRAFDRNLKYLNMITEDHLNTIHESTMEILEATGVAMQSNETLRFLAGHGCEINTGDKRVRFPRDLVHQCLEKVPSSFLLKARNPEHNLDIGDDRLCFSNSMGMKTVDLDTWLSRVPTREENETAVKVLESLETVSYIAPYTPYMEIEGVPPAMVLLEGMATKLRLASKAVSSAYQFDSELFAIRMAEVVGIDLLGAVSVSSPLTYDKAACRVLHRWVEAGFPICIGSGAIMGANGPVTVAGATILNNAELLAGTVLAQLIKPGIGVLVADFVHPMDMLRGTPVFGAVECAIHGTVFEQAFRRYGIPTIQWYGFGSSKKIDFQSGYERSMLTLLGALSGSNVIEMHGAIYGELTWHPAQAVIDEDVIGWIKRYLNGVQVDDETLALDLIKEVGPKPGYYLDTEHTLRWCRKGQFLPKVADRTSYHEWAEEIPRKDILNLAVERVKEIVSKYEPNPLTKEQNKEIDTILKEARKHYEDSGWL
jgi:trimethylamine--corrinoid protein Co-methyltransferase